MVSLFRQRQSNIAKCYSMNRNLVYWNNTRIDGRIATWTRLWAIGGLSLIHLQLVWRQCHSTTEIRSLLSNGSSTSHERNVRDTSGFAVRNKLWRTALEYICRPKSYSNADCAARRIDWILLPLLRMGQPSEGLPLQNKKMATPFRNNTRSEECGASCFRG
jgi:hypothetical protein